MTDLTKYQTDHLILLVGSNPLPNWVATHLLWRKTKEENRLFFVHSADTHAAAKRLRDLLMKQNGDLDKDHDFRFIRVEEADAGDIYTQLKNQIHREVPSGDIGLNYTGGTKVMAVHARKAIADLVAGRKLICSYLDARTYEMRFDFMADGTLLSPIKDVWQYDAVKISLKNLLELHYGDVKFQKDVIQRNPVFVAGAKALATLHYKSKNAGKWRDWYKRECEESDLKKKDEAILQSTSLRLSDSPDVQKTIQSLCEELTIPITMENSTIKDVIVPKYRPEDPLVQEIAEYISQKLACDIPIRDISIETFSLSRVVGEHFNTIKSFIEWLGGFWLEHYVLDQVQQIIAEKQLGLTDYGRNLDTIKLSHKPDFELDVAMMRGYQLFGISCATAVDNYTIKHKLFEAYIRARQLGGDEARVAVVCPHDKPQNIRKEMEFDARGKVEVFGAKHLPNLADHLKKWILGEQ